MTDALDEALCSVARIEFDRLSNGLRDEQTDCKIRGTLESLGNLTMGIQPEYADEWVALFYSLWYQPAQINLVYTMIKKMIELRNYKDLILDNSGRLRIIDFGCGTLAMQFAVALAAADALEQGQSITEIRIDSYDINQSMPTMGDKIWRQFKSEVSKYPGLEYLSRSCSIARPRICISYIPTDWEVAEDYWISAIHTVYSSNIHDVKDKLAYITKEINPNVGFITSHAHNRQLVEQASPFNTNGCLFWYGESSEFSGELPKVTKWRRNLYDSGYRHQFLLGEVTWAYPRPACLIYIRGG